MQYQKKIILKDITAKWKYSVFYQGQPHNSASRPWVYLSGMCEEFESNAKNMTIRIEGHPGERTECVKRKTYQYHHHEKTGIVTNRMKLFIDSWFESYYFPKAQCFGKLFWENSMKLQLGS